MHFKCVGKNETVSLGIKAVGASGRVVTVGKPFTDMSFDREVYWRILWNELTVTGTWNSSFCHDVVDDWHYILDRREEGRIALNAMISYRLGLEDVENELQMIRDKSMLFLKNDGIEYIEIGGAYPYLPLSSKKRRISDFKESFGGYLHPIYGGVFKWDNN